MLRQKFINGVRKSFNTRTAEEVVKTSGYSINFKGKKIEKGPWRFHETLYRTPTGEYFIHGFGGICTRWNGGEDIAILDEQSLNHWMKKRGINADVITRKKEGHGAPVTV